MVNINKVFKSKYLKPLDLDGRSFTMKIVGITIEEFEGDDQPKPIVQFQGAEKKLVLNRTNSSIIADTYGPETEDWIGKDISVFTEKVLFKGKMVNSVRVSCVTPPTVTDGMSLKNTIAQQQVTEGRVGVSTVTPPIGQQGATEGRGADYDEQPPPNFEEIDPDDLNDDIPF